MVNGPHTTGDAIVLVGNPNCGKSVLFNRMTGMYVNVSNFPGTTVDISRGSWLGKTLIDTPGVYGLSSYSDEERITRDSVFQADLVINVVNATTLERDLFLTLQLADLGVPMVVVLNMMDEVERLGLQVEADALQKRVGVPVVPVVAITGQGLPALKVALTSARPGQASMVALKAIAEVRAQARMLGLRPSQAELLLIAEGDAEVAARIGLTAGNFRSAIYTARRRRADKLAAKAVAGTVRRSFGQALGEWSAHPLLGLPILAGVLYALYWLMGVVVAQIVVDYTEGTLMSGYYEPFMRRLAAPLLGEQTFAYRLLVGDFGLLTMTVTYLIGLLLPLVTGFYLALSFLEDSGYLPRIAFLTDRILNKIGLNGRAVIPMILGLGCVTMATLTTRVLSSRRERTIALALLGIAIPCSAQLGVIASLVTPLGVRALLTYVLVILFVYGLVGMLLNKILPGCSSDLLLDLPPLRFPGLGNIVKKTSARVYGFLWEAAPIFAGGVVLVAVMQESGVLLTIQQALTPITVHWLQLPASSAQAFVMGLVRRDFGAAGLYALPMSATQKLTASITITLFVPCVASMLVMWKERGWREAAAIFVGSLIIAVGVGGLASRLVSWLAPLIITSV